MKIATFALALGLGGLGGYAISSSKDKPAGSGVVAEGTKVVRRTVHVKKHKPKATDMARARAAQRHTRASEPVSTGSSGSESSGSSGSAPVHTGSSGSSSHSGGGSAHKPVNTGSSGSSGGGSSKPPVSTGSSGAGGGGGATGEGEGDGGGEHEVGDD
jgi:hypothetical protein